MEQLTKLHRIATQQGIKICYFALPETGSLSIQDEQAHCYIGLDEQSMQTQADLAVHLAHEVGHCVTGSFYNRYAACDLRQKHENRADRWAIRKLIDPAELYDACNRGLTQLWELAEHFDVTEAFMEKALGYYLHTV